MTASLPPAFADLEPFVADWTCSGMAQRLHRRTESSAEERVRFYEAMVPRIEPIMAYLNATPLDGLTPESERLLSLMLMLAEISLTQEVNGQAIEAVHAQGNRMMRIDKELDGR